MQSAVVRYLSLSYNILRRSLPDGQFYIIKRQLTVSETATALRPFYLVVHPDLYGQSPKERKVNEESLKKLHEYITDLHKTGRAKPTNISFYIKGKNPKDKYKYVKVNLESGDIRTTVTNVLKSVSLPLEYLSSIPDTKHQKFERPVRWDPAYYHFTGKPNPYKQYYEATNKDHQGTLSAWLQKNGTQAKKKLETSRLIQKEIDKLYVELIDDVGLEDIKWYSDWGISHYMGCLRSFSRLCKSHPERVRKILKGRSLVFSNKTGVSLHGEVVLSSSDVTTDWMTLLSYVPAYDAVLERLPYMEKQLSDLLGNIQIKRRRKKQIIMAPEYELVLNKILNSLRNCQTDVDKYFSGEDLSNLELIVEQDSAPMTLSSTGKFLVPSSIPAILLIKFISENRKKAYMILQDMALQIQMEEMVSKQCKEYFQLLSLDKEDNVSPDKMTQCCERLLEDKIYLEAGLNRSKLNIAHYYTVMQDGEMSIPWNWTSDIS